MIFPGMDPYLEDPQLWPGVHNRLVVYIADELQPRLEPRYLAAVEDACSWQVPTARSFRTSGSSGRGGKAAAWRWPNLTRR